MKPRIDVHRFNDDLLIGRDARDLAVRNYGEILHVLEHPELQKLFEESDEPASRAKSRARSAGVWAIGLIWLALAIASLDHLFKDENWAHGLAVISAVFGLAGVVIGSTGILFATKKQEWLYRRFMTERIRQFHFQSFIFRLPEILSSLRDEKNQSAFLSKRQGWLRDFTTRCNDKVEEQFVSVIEDEAQTNIWLHESELEPSSILEHPDLAPVFAAYRELRIVHQISYANYQLREDRRIFSSAPRQQTNVFSKFSFTCVALICAIHAGVIVAVLSKSPPWAESIGIAGLLVILIAITAIAVRAIEDGFQPAREIERYQQYRSAVQFILERFDGAKSTKAKVQTMREMERLAFDEMRNFLITGNRSRFVL